MKNKKYQLALFGDPVKHSLSPQIHKAFAAQFDLCVDYHLIQVDDSEFDDGVGEFFSSGGHGANVTLPHKNLALNWVTTASQKAQQAQAVNTFHKDKSGKVTGDNTDGIGFIKDLQQRCGFHCLGKSVLVLGAGGAAQGIVPAMVTQNPDQIVIANRSIDKAKSLAADKNCKAVALDVLNSLKQPFDLIVHTSSLGHHGQSLLFYDHQVHADTICYDLSYGKAALPFIELAQSMNIDDVYDGMGMLIEQAAAAFYLWFGVEPDTRGMVEQFVQQNR